MDATYRFSTRKAYDAIHWMVSRGTPVDLHAALKTCYFADKSHINEYFQPIWGANYRAMKYGPVPVEIYEMIKGEGLLLWELEADDTPWRLDGYRVSAKNNTKPEMSAFSESEMEHLEAGFKLSSGMNFTSRTAATHGRDWQVANGGRMRYEDMIDDTPNRDSVIRFLQESAPHVRL